MIFEVIYSIVDWYFNIILKKSTVINIAIELFKQSKKLIYVLEACLNHILQQLLTNS